MHQQHATHIRQYKSSLTIDRIHIAELLMEKKNYSIRPMLDALNGWVSAQHTPEQRNLIYVHNCTGGV